MSRLKLSATSLAKIGKNLEELRKAQVDNISLNPDDSSWAKTSEICTPPAVLCVAFVIGAIYVGVLTIAAAGVAGYAGFAVCGPSCEASYRGNEFSVYSFNNLA